MKKKKGTANAACKVNGAATPATPAGAAEEASTFTVQLPPEAKILKSMCKYIYEYVVHIQYIYFFFLRRFVNISMSM